MKIKNNKKASLVLISLLLVGFLLVLSTGILKVILTDSKDTYGMKNSLKAFYGAESGLELALLRLKLKGFGYEYSLENGKRESNVLGEKVSLNYKINSISQTATGTIKSGRSVIYPLFYKTGSQDFSKNSSIKDLDKLDLELTGGTGSLITWGLIGKPKSGTTAKGLNGNGDDVNKGTTKYLDSSNKLVFASGTINDFLSNHTGSYLQIGNLNTGDIKYKLKGEGTQEYFTGKKTIITSSARVGRNKQNIELKIDNSEYLNIFRFTLYDTANH